MQVHLQITTKISAHVYIPWHHHSRAWQQQKKNNIYAITCLLEAARYVNWMKLIKQLLIAHITKVVYEKQNLGLGGPMSNHRTKKTHHVRCGKNGRKTRGLMYRTLPTCWARSKIQNVSVRSLKSVTLIIENLNCLCHSNPQVGRSESSM